MTSPWSKCAIWESIFQHFNG